jgi:hypothetical protein
LCSVSSPKAVPVTFGPPQMGTITCRYTGSLAGLMSESSHTGGAATIPAPRSQEFIDDFRGRGGLWPRACRSDWR